MIAVQVRELNEIDGQLKQVVLVTIICISEDPKSIPKIKFIATKNFIQLSKITCWHLYSFYTMQRYELPSSAFLIREDTFFKPCLVSCKV